VIFNVIKNWDINKKFSVILIRFKIICINLPYSHGIQTTNIAVVTPGIKKSPSQY
jgi:hypothetical protein